MNSITPKKKVYSDLPTGEKMADMARFLQEHKAQNVTTIDLSGRGSFTDGLVIATATSVRHAQSLADGISALCHEKKYEYLRMDGYTNGQWLLVDCNDVVVNIFQEATREMYACIRNLHREGCAILTVTHDVEAALDEAEHILCLCQRHPAPGTHAAPFYGTADAYRAFLEHGCDCHGTHDTL